jgi:8-oxo-dGTP diphosphatase
MTSIEKFKLIPAVFVLVKKGNKVFLARRINTGFKDGEYSLVGGHIDGNEKATTTAARELGEELGIKADPKDFRFANVTHIKTNDERIHFLFVIEKWKGEPTINEPEKASDGEWFDLDNLPEDLNDLSLDMIQAYQNNIPYKEFGWNNK